MASKKKLAVLSFVFAGAIIVGGGSPASAAYGTFADGTCSASKYHNVGEAMTTKLAGSGSCGVLSVNLRVQTNSGGHIYWTGWYNSPSGVIAIERDAPASAGVISSDHGVKNRNTTSYLP